LIRCSAVDAIGDFTGDFAGFFVDGLPFDDEGLADMGEIQIGVHLGCDPDFAGVDASVVAGRRFDEIRISAALEEQLDSFKESGLVAFYGKMVMGLSSNEVIADFALGQ